MPVYGFMGGIFGLVTRITLAVDFLILAPCRTRDLALQMPAVCVALETQATVLSLAANLFLEQALLQSRDVRLLAHD